MEDFNHKKSFKASVIDLKITKATRAAEMNMGMKTITAIRTTALKIQIVSKWF